MHWKIIIIMLFIIASLSLFSGCLEEGNEINEKPNVEIHYPQNGITISGLVKIFGIAYDLDEDDNIEKVEINLNNS